MKFASLLLSSFCLAASAADIWPAADWYVDDDAAAAGADGSREHPYPTIQQAVKAASANQTIYVAEGVYTNGQTQVSKASYARVHINNKPGLKLLGAGRGKSFIVGSRDPAATAYNDTLTATRTNLVSCVYVKNSSGVIIEGFTLRDGEMFYAEQTLGATGGAGLAENTNSRDVYLVDCDILHCCARVGAGTSGGTAVRCRFEDNYGMSGAVSRFSALVNCLIARNWCPSSYGIMGGVALYNCTMFGNEANYAVQDAPGNAVTNCLIALSSIKKGDLAAEFQTASDPVCDSVLASTASKGYVQFMAPGFDDFRLRSDSDAIGAGRATHLSTLELPTGIDAFKDLTGATIVPDAEGRINAGAIQATATAAGGALVFKGGTYAVEGVTNSVMTYVCPAAYPTQYCVRAVLDEGQHLFRIHRYDLASGAASTNLPAMVPFRDGSMWMMPPPDPSVGVLNVMQTADTVKYVDPNPNVGSDEGTGSVDSPYATIQKAMDAADRYTVIYLRPGEYTNDVQDIAARGKFRVYQTDNNHYIRIVSTDGPETTIIRGQPDPDFDDGLGPKAIKGVFLGRNTILQGVTLADCFTDNTNTTQAAYYNGAAVYGDSSISTAPPQVIDCIITNCQAGQYVMVNHLVIRRCRLYDCTTLKQHVIGTGSASQHYFPLFACYTRGVNNLIGGSGSQGIIGGDARIYQCTFTGTIGSGRLTGSGNISWNSIWYGGKNIYSTSVYTNCFVYKPAGTANGIYEKTDPLFADGAASGALCANSPAIGAGAAPTADNFGADYWRYACGDIDGNPIAFDAAGRPTLGAFQVPDAGKVRVAVAEPAKGGWALSGGGYGTIEVAAGDAFSFVPAEGTRPCIGVTCGGTDYLFTNAPSETVVLDYAKLAVPGATAVEGIYSTDWYVDDDGDDGATGFLPTHPKKTLASAAELLSSGDTLWAFPGVYTNGFAFHTEKAVASRVVVKADTSLVSLEGPARTIIKGAAATIDPDEYGCGTNAVRCAFVRAGGRLSGFTLTGGRTYNYAPNGNNFDKHWADGGGVYGGGRGSGSRVENCVISNNVARYGGGVTLADVFASVVVGNTASTGSGMRESNAYGCLVAGNRGAAVLSYMCNVYECTVADDNKTLSGGTPTTAASTVAGGGFCNSLFKCKLALASDTIVSNCVCETGSSFGSGTTTGNVWMVDFSTQAFTDGVVPVAGANVAVDAADETLCTNAFAAADLRGFQRVANGRRDIGAYEADWRGKYAQKLGGGSGFAVTSADEQVVLEEGSPLTVRDGTLAAEWTNTSGKPRRYGCGVAVTGTGTLAVTLNGEPFAAVAAADGAQHLEFKNAAALNSLEFSYTPGENDSGWAVLSDFTREGGGLKLNIR